jgi:MFS transporter, PPP family, 3-phenylpropionic acid transporter
MRAKGLSLSLRFSVFYWALFLQTGLILPFWPLVLAWRDLSAAEIGLVSAAAPAARILIGPLIGFACDRYRLGRGFLFALAIVSAVGLSGFGLVRGFLPILLLTLIVAPLYPSIAPLIDAHALRRAGQNGLDFGQMRRWGSIGFIFANLLGGALIAGSDRMTIIGLVVLVTLLGGLAAPILPPLNEPASAPAAHPDWSMAGALLRTPAFLAVTLIAGSIQATHALLYSFGSLGWRAQGLGESAIGFLWAAGVLAEVALLSLSKPMLRRFGADGLLILGGAAAVMRWLAMSLAPPFAVLVLLQLLHAFTFAATYLGSVHLVQRSAPRALMATAQALYAAIAAGALFSAATAISGTLYGAFGASSYLAPALLAGLATAAAILLLRRRHRGLLIPTAPDPAEP